MTFDGKNWTSKIVETSNDYKIWMYGKDVYDFRAVFQLTIVKDIQKER